MLNNDEPYQHLNDNTQNILYSLGYLMEEAKRSGSAELYEIMKAAYLLGQKSTENTGIEGKHNESIGNAAQFIFHFLEASPDTQKETLSILEKTEQDI